MATDSTEAGYLLPTDPPLHDDSLEDLFQAWVVGVTGINGSLVRPRWQEDPPNPPPHDVNWVAVGVNVAEPQWNAYQKFHPEIGPEGSYLVEGNEVIEVLLSFYGPDHTMHRRNLQEGLQIDQNLDSLYAQKIKYKECRNPVNVPALLKQRWRMRSDVRVIFHRWVVRTYPIKTIQSATVDLDNERYLTPISVTPPSP